jgi:hypothetical protein
MSAASLSIQQFVCACLDVPERKTSKILLGKLGITKLHQLYLLLDGSSTPRDLVLNAIMVCQVQGRRFVSERIVTELVRRCIYTCSSGAVVENAPAVEVPNPRAAGSKEDASDEDTSEDNEYKEEDGEEEEEANEEEDEDEEESDEEKDDNGEREELAIFRSRLSSKLKNKARKLKLHPARGIRVSSNAEYLLQRLSDKTLGILGELVERSIRSMMACGGAHLVQLQNVKRAEAEIDAEEAADAAAEATERRANRKRKHQAAAFAAHVVQDKPSAAKRMRTKAIARAYSRLPSS